MKKWHLLNKRGTLFIALMLAITLGAGLAANYLAPRNVVIEKRITETTLQRNLSELRAAMRFERILETVDSAIFDSDWTNSPTPTTTSVSFQTYLQQLVDKGYLAEIPRDPTVPADRWGPEDGKLFWIPTQNLVKYPGFEEKDFADMGGAWEMGDPANIFATPTESIIGLDTYSWPGDATKVSRSLLLIKAP